MAFENEKSEILASMKKNERGDFIVVQKITTMDTDELVALDFRRFYTDHDMKEQFPTKQGVRLNPDQLAEVAKVLKVALPEYFG